MPDIVTISKEVEFDAGHRVPNHKSKCRNPHGHRYRVCVHATGTIVEEPGASDEGMLIDFSDLKTLLTKKVHDVLDHGFIVYKDDHDLLSCFEVNADGEAFDCWKIIIFPYVPTAENIARWVWEELYFDMEDHFRGNLRLKCIEIWETPTSRAYYEGETDGQ